MEIDTEKLGEIRHEFLSHGQMFHSYHELLLNPQLNINHKKLAEICGKCAKACLEVSNIILREVNDE